MKAATTIGWQELAAVLAGGMLGTSARLSIDLLLPHSDTQFPLDTLMVNTAGTFLLALAVAILWSRPALPNWAKAGLGAGLLGSFTTFSAIMVSLVAQTVSGEWMLAAIYLAASVVLGLAAAAAGLSFRKFTQPRRPAEPDWVDE